MGARVHAAHIGVSVTNGVATLQGFVTSLREKHLAERVTRRVYSVRAIANEVVVAPDGAFNMCRWRRTTERWC
jgi:osmotically-inducible protein OsmY